MASSRRVASEYLERAGQVLGSIGASEVDAFTDILYEAWSSGNTIYTCGNGGSAGTAQHLAADLFKCATVPGHRPVRAMCLNDNMPLISALTNDDGWDEIYVRQLETWWIPGDVVLGISVHGGRGRDRAGAWSQNVIRALRYANENGGKSLGLVGFDGGEMMDLCTRSIVVPVDSTPHAEGLHVVVHHLVTTLLRHKIERDDENSS